MPTYTMGGTGTILDLGITGLGDIGSHYQDITFKFTDGNANYTPQSRIRCRVGRYHNDANTLSKEGCGSLEFYTSSGDEGSTGTENLCMYMGYNGNVGIGGDAGSDPGYNLKVSGTFYSSGSSRDYKDNIEDYTPDTSLLSQLRPVTYDYKADYVNMGYKLGSEKQIGLIAEEVAEVYPELAIKDFQWNPEAVNPETGEATGQNEWQIRNVDYQKLAVILLKEVQNLRAEVDKLKSA